MSALEKCTTKYIDYNNVHNFTFGKRKIPGGKSHSLLQMERTEQGKQENILCPPHPAMKTRGKNNVLYMGHTLLNIINVAIIWQRGGPAVVKNQV